MLIRYISSMEGNLQRITSYGRYKGNHICFDTWKDKDKEVARRCVIWNNLYQWILHKNKKSKGWVI